MGPDPVGNLPDGLMPRGVELAAGDWSNLPVATSELVATLPLASIELANSPRLEALAWPTNLPGRVLRLVSVQRHYRRWFTRRLGKLMSRTPRLASK